MTRRSFPMAIAGSLLLLAASQARAEEALDVAIERGELYVGIASESFAPWLANDKEGGRMGFEIDIASAVAESIDLDLTFVEVPFDQLMTRLGNGDIDVIISAMSISANRAVSVYFTQPYGQIDNTLVLDKQRIPEGAAEAGYDMEGIQIGVTDGSLVEAIAKETFKTSKIIPLSDAADIRDAFLDEKIDGAIIPSPYPAYLVGRNPDRFVAAEDPISSSRQGMAVRMDSPHLLNVLNAWIIEAEASGTLDEIYSYWFESGDWLSKLEGYEDE